MATPKQYLYGTIDAEGRLTFSDSVAFARVRGALREQAVQILIEPRRKPRSLQENGYYWGVVIPILCDWTGYTTEEMHEALKAELLGQYDKEHGISRIKSTAALSMTEFEEYLMKVRRWASDNGVFIPLPNEEIY